MVDIKMEGNRVVLDKAHIKADGLLPRWNMQTIEETETQKDAQGNVIGFTSRISKVSSGTPAFRRTTNGSSTRSMGRFLSTTLRPRPTGRSRPTTRLNIAIPATWVV